MTSAKADWQQVQNDFYSDPEKHTHLAYEANSTYAKNLTAHLVEAIGLSAGQTILEVGAGAGRFTPHLSPYVGKVVALDTSAQLLDALKQKSGKNNIEIACASVFDLPLHYGEQAFDAICGFFILHHLPDHPRLFERFKVSLKQGAHLAFIEPNRLNPLFLLQVLFSKEMTWEAEKGMFTLSRNKTMKLLQRLGFYDVRCKCFGFFPPQILDRWPWLVKFELVLERIPVLREVLPFHLITASKK
jgi:ubiquinone/menaquinone biosynthesis C-methylase UbiE